MSEHLVDCKDRPLTHIAIIMDGNGRWAKMRGLPRSAGHRRGAKAVRRAISGAIKLGVPYLTLYGFSAENWQRPVLEVNNLMGLLRRYLQSDLSELHAEEVRFQVIGQRPLQGPAQKDQNVLCGSETHSSACQTQTPWLDRSQGRVPADRNRAEPETTRKA